MNKQELIEKIEALPAEDYKYRPHIDKKMVLGLVRQLDEPEKVTIPQFVANYIEWTKEEDYHLLGAMIEIRSHKNKETYEWFWDYDDNMELFARAWLDGYKVEKEKRYLVKIKRINGYGRYLNKALLSEEYFFASDNEICGYRTKHTRKELEDAGFGEVFNSPLFEIEEVER